MITPKIVNKISSKWLLCPFRKKFDTRIANLQIIRPTAHGHPMMLPTHRYRIRYPILARTIWKTDTYFITSSDIGSGPDTDIGSDNLKALLWYRKSCCVCDIFNFNFPRKIKKKTSRHATPLCPYVLLYKERYLKNCMNNMWLYSFLVLTSRCLHVIITKKYKANDKFNPTYLLFSRIFLWLIWYTTQSPLFYLELAYIKYATSLYQLLSIIRV